MKRRSILDSSDAGSEEINISPLIDMVFILLIFFIVTTVFVEETGVDVDKPQAASAKDLEKNVILIAVTDQGRVIYGGNEIGLGGIRSVVRSLIQNEQLPVIIQADKNGTVDVLMRVHDEVKLAGAEIIQVSTDKI